MTRGILSDYPERYYECRDLGHSWDIVSGMPASMQRRRVVVEDLTCSRCGTQQTRAVYKGEILQREYRYPEGYLQKDVKGMKRRDYRAARIERAIAKIMTKG